MRHSVEASHRHRQKSTGQQSDPPHSRHPSASAREGAGSLPDLTQTGSNFATGGEASSSAVHTPAGKAGGSYGSGREITLHSSRAAASEAGRAPPPGRSAASPANNEAESAMASVSGRSPAAAVGSQPTQRALMGRQASDGGADVSSSVGGEAGSAPLFADNGSLALHMHGVEMYACRLAPAETRHPAGRRAKHASHGTTPPMTGANTPPMEMSTPRGTEQQAAPAFAPAAHPNATAATASAADGAEGEEETDDERWGSLKGMTNMIQNTSIHVSIFTDTRRGGPADGVYGASHIHVCFADEFAMRMAPSSYDALMAASKANLAEGSNCFARQAAAPPPVWNTDYVKDPTFGPPASEVPWMVVTVAADAATLTFDNDPSWWDGRREVR